MADKNNFQETVEALFKGMDGILATKTVVGEPMKVGDTMLIPLADVSFGVAAGASSNNPKQTGAGGLGAKIVPTAIMVVNEDGIRMVRVKNEDTISKIIEMVPDIISKFTKKKKGDECSVEELEDIVNEKQ